MTQEDAGGIIYSSAYFLMVIQDEYSASNSALTTMLNSYKLEVCDEFFADKGAFTPTIAVTPSNGGFFNPGANGSNAVYVFDRF